MKKTYSAQNPMIFPSPTQHARYVDLKQNCAGVTDFKPVALISGRGKRIATRASGD